MNEEFWLKYGFKENGELACVRVLANSEPESSFFYMDGGCCKPVKDSRVIRLTKEVIGQLNGGKIR
ncbi:MAG: hypothetical protein KKC75_01800 [Nanoarchaeota archaeon]|nr:hypothetical protein [Nanoarchaeota archaeon]MBU1005731.1 hypothetical protein [Nanoarchaeota archaeon]MBU1945584.1 hypothetical protein [Nanoarchaeota archaeon]